MGALDDDDGVFTHEDEGADADCSTRVAVAVASGGEWWTCLRCSKAAVSASTLCGGLGIVALGKLEGEEALATAEPQETELDDGSVADEFELALVGMQAIGRGSCPDLVRESSNSLISPCILKIHRVL